MDGGRKDQQEPAAAGRQSQAWHVKAPVIEIRPPFFRFKDLCMTATATTSPPSASRTRARLYRARCRRSR
jgi:hypothetical protein